MFLCGLRWWVWSGLLRQRGAFPRNDGSKLRAVRMPIFMYLTDYRETCLKDVITQLEPGLFKKVTGLNVKDFEILCSLGVFNASLMNDAIFKFKRYEDASLSYTGVNRHDGSAIGGWDTVIQEEDYRRLFYNQQAVEGSGGLLRRYAPRNDESGVRDSGSGLLRRASAARNDGVMVCDDGEKEGRGLLRSARNDENGVRNDGKTARNDVGDDNGFGENCANSLNSLT